MHVPMWLLSHACQQASAIRACQVLRSCQLEGVCCSRSSALQTIPGFILSTASPSRHQSASFHHRGIATCTPALDAAEKKRGVSSASRGTDSAVKGNAAQAMDDPMSQLLASRGMPLGMALHNKGSTDVLRDAPGEDPSVPPSPEPAYDMEALKEALEAAQTSTTISTGHSSGTSARSGSNSSVNYIGGMNRGFAASVYDAQDLSGSDGGREGDVRRGGSDFIQQGDEPVAVQQSGMAVDHWGTTRESGAEIARRLAEANEQAAPTDTDHLAASSASSSVLDSSDDADSDSEDEMMTPGALQGDAQKFEALEDISRDIKKLDEVWELLACVPWLDRDDASEAELRGMATGSLMGTLTQVGFSVEGQLKRIWAGERNPDMIMEGQQYRDQAALLAVLYHSKQLEDKYGPPPKGFMHMESVSSGTADVAGAVQGGRGVHANAQQQLAGSILSSLAGGLPSQKGG